MATRHVTLFTTTIRRRRLSRRKHRMRLHDTRLRTSMSSSSFLQRARRWRRWNSNDNDVEKRGDKGDMVACLREYAETP